MQAGPTFWLVALRLLAKPLARFCLRHSLRIQDALEALKIALVQEASEEMRSSGLEPNLSRISVMTGLHRRDVTRIAARGETKSEPQGMLARLIGQWQHDSRFSTKRGQPRVLTWEGEESEFSQLVRLVSRDLKPATILFELERSGMLERTARGVRLKDRVVSTHGQALPTMQLLARDVSEFTLAAEQNAVAYHEVPNLHGRTYYDRIVASAEPAIREWFIEQGSELHRRARAFLSQFDQDVNPSLAKDEETIRVSLGSYSLTEPNAKKRGESDENDE